jgi:phosphoribosyl 1,2-cyclic phosphodiesterase
MNSRFTVLASGSSGNAALVEAGGFGLLIDCGLPPRILTSRLAEVGASWTSINAVILTHTHSDHWKDHTLGDLRSRRIPLWGHPAQFDHLMTVSASFEPLYRARLTNAYQENHPHFLCEQLSVRPIRVSHDSDPTFAFRIDGRDSLGIAWSIGYASDLGCASPELIEAFAGVDILAIEYNHDVKMERASPRPKYLVDRVLSDHGHLSNDQAAQVTNAVAARSGEGFPSHLVQLHLSRDCNRPELASAVGRAALASLNPKTEVITARQDIAARSIPLKRRSDADCRLLPRVKATSGFPNGGQSTKVQPRLPGFDG